MRSRGVVGKRIVRIDQKVISVDHTGDRRTNVVFQFVLEDGTLLVPITIETDWGDYGHEFVVVPPKRK
jgi:hypothetical protein